MLGKQAKILAPRDAADLLAFADCSRHPLRNRVIVLLSAKVGLRAGEIAGLTWDMVLDAAVRSVRRSSSEITPQRKAQAGASRSTLTLPMPFRFCGRLRPGGRDTWFGLSAVAQ